jgi:ParB-like chromosome segregation protein Spo0J
MKTVIITLKTNKMKEEILKLIPNYSELSIDEQIDAINTIKIALHEISPMRNEPVDCVLWVKNETVRANDYNPNAVAPPEMELLRQSLMAENRLLILLRLMLMQR